MTPEEARDLLDGTTPGPWHVDPQHSGDILSPENHWLAGTYETGEGFTADELARAQADAALIAHATTLAAMIAGMRTEYAIEHQHTPGGQWHQVTGWSHEPPLNDGHTLTPDERIIRRYVTTPEEA